MARLGHAEWRPRAVASATVAFGPRTGAAAHPPHRV